MVPTKARSPVRLETEDAYLREPEIAHVSVLLLPGSDEDVRRLDVAVDEPETVRGIERGGDLSEQAQRPLVVDPLGRVEQRTEVIALHVLHCEVQGAVDLAGGVDRDDIGVLEARGELRLEEKPAAEAIVVRELGREHLQCHLAAQMDVLREVDRAHRAATDEPFDAEACHSRAEGDLGAHARGLTVFVRDVTST